MEAHLRPSSAGTAKINEDRFRSKRRPSEDAVKAKDVNLLQYSVFRRAVKRGRQSTSKVPIAARSTSKSPADQSGSAQSGSAQSKSALHALDWECSPRLLAHSGSARRAAEQFYKRCKQLKVGAKRAEVNE